MENIISEFRVIETDDGFRIEIKGDKEKLRPFITGEAGPGAWHHGPWRHHRGPFGMFGLPLHFMRWGGPWWGGWSSEQGEEGEASGPQEA